MNKIVFIALALFTGLTNAAIAATSLSTNGSWQTANGDLSSLLGQSAPATWSYDTDLASATLYSSYALPSTGTVSTYVSSNYVLSGTAAPTLFDGSQFALSILDNTIANLDAFNTDIVTSMVNKGLNPDITGDAILFTTSTLFPVSEFTESFSLSGLMMFDKDFFTGPISTLPSADILLDNALFIYASLSHEINFEETGFASYIQTPSAVPVPAALWMFAPALLGFLGLHRKVNTQA